MGASPWGGMSRQQSQLFQVSTYWHTVFYMYTVEDWPPGGVYVCVRASRSTLWMPRDKLSIFAPVNDKFQPGVTKKTFSISLERPSPLSSSSPYPFVYLHIRFFTLLEFTLSAIDIYREWLLIQISFQDLKRFKKDKLARFSLKLVLKTF